MSWPRTTCRRGCGCWANRAEGRLLKVQSDSLLKRRGLLYRRCVKMRISALQRTLRACNRDKSRFAGAKARADFAALAARLKSGPVTRHGFSAACEVVSCYRAALCRTSLVLQLYFVQFLGMGSMPGLKALLPPPKSICSCSTRRVRRGSCRRLGGGDVLAGEHDGVAADAGASADDGGHQRDVSKLSDSWVWE